MREHQIVITLKPDQFLEVQRLARAANAKSMGIFVRQHLLAALGIEGGGTGSGAGEEAKAENLQAAVCQIKRLHGELKTFVAESLSLYNVGMPAPAADVGSQPAAPSAAPPSDALENLAERTFAISPRLGPIGQLPDAPDKVVAATGADSRRQELPRREQHRSHHLPSAGALADSEIEDAAAARTENAPPFDDPLHKLLPEDEQPNWPQPSSVTTFPVDSLGTADVPPSLAQRLAGSFYSVDEQAQLVPGTAEEAASAGSDFASEVELDSASADEEQSQSPQPAPGEPKPKAPPPMGHPSLSGSPPPKRRQV